MKHEFTWSLKNKNVLSKELFSFQFLCFFILRFEGPWACDLFKTWTCDCWLGESTHAAGSPTKLTDGLRNQVKLGKKLRFQVGQIQILQVNPYISHWYSRFCGWFASAQVAGISQPKDVHPWMDHGWSNLTSENGCWMLVPLKGGIIRWHIYIYIYIKSPNGNHGSCHQVPCFIANEAI